MFRHYFAFATVGTLLIGGLLSSPVRADDSPVTRMSVNGVAVQVEELQPFTHVTYVPAGAEPGTILFEKAREVKVPTQVRYTTYTSYCKDLVFRDAGSMFCPQVETGAPVTAYELTYSYRAQPMVSDEQGNRRFTFKVFLRPDEVSPEARQALFASRRNRRDGAGYLRVNTYRENVQRVVIDEAQSHLCPTAIVDGAWAHEDASCQDAISYKIASAPSDMIAVRVDLVPPVRVAGDGSTRR
jgi:hypothetical protein